MDKNICVVGKCTKVVVNRKGRVSTIDFPVHLRWIIQFFFACGCEIFMLAWRLCSSDCPVRPPPNKSERLGGGCGEIPLLVVDCLIRCWSAQFRNWSMNLMLSGYLLSRFQLSWHLRFQEMFSSRWAFPCNVEVIVDWSYVLQIV